MAFKKIQIEMEFLNTSVLIAIPFMEKYITNPKGRKGIKSLKNLVSRITFINVHNKTKN